MRELRLSQLDESGRRHQAHDSENAPWRIEKKKEAVTNFTTVCGVKRACAAPTIEGVGDERFHTSMK